MKTQTRIVSWSLFAVGVCSLVPFVVHWRDAQLAFALGREAGAETMGATIFFRQTFIAGMIAYCMIILFAAWRAKIRFSWFNVLLAGFLAFACSIVTHVGWVFVGKSPANCYFDGFAERVTASGIESNAITWVEQLAANQSLNPKGYESVDLPPDKVPPFFAPIFGKMGTPEVTVYYNKDRKELESVDIHVGLAAIVRPVEWGISIVADADAEVSRLPDVYAGRRCGKRLMAYWGGD